ncbi:HK97 family phage prohead protease [Sphingomonas lacunae]|uniref:HK97 family phage prohead protease n=1 Tax=Sphingomonas lacunae TaxID=2698828 RepID=A0A6M4ATD8_9SPHN|nr:HK97 family phage prohead protease [Sphingomonas lacunae]QJQ32378.1 HK97 family phage prohead protease [Sphingomonas lacunae]
MSGTYEPFRFAGYAALFGVRDRGGDVIRPGAFASLGSGAVPLLWQHDPARRIGTVETLAEDARGLRVVARIEGEGATAREVAAMLREGAVDGLSFGYRVKASRAGLPGRDGLATRVLEAIELVEVSVVAQPMQPGARVIAVG